MTYISFKGYPDQNIVLDPTVSVVNHIQILPSSRLSRTCSQKQHQSLRLEPSAARRLSTNNLFHRHMYVHAMRT